MRCRNPKITASAVAPRDSYYIAAKHVILVFPCVGTELRVIDLDTAFTVIDNDEARSEIDQWLKVFKRNRPRNRNNDLHNASFFGSGFFRSVAGGTGGGGPRGGDLMRMIYGALLAT
jgi:hypothetical protein